MTEICNVCHVIGNVMDRRRNHITERLTINKVLNLLSPWYEETFIDRKQRGWYHVTDPQGVRKVVIVGYWHIIIKLIQKGK